MCQRATEVSNQARDAGKERRPGWGGGTGYQDFTGVDLFYLILGVLLAGKTSFG
jgi:hypothetical protein